MKQSFVMKQLLLAGGASLALAGTSAHALDFPCIPGTGLTECYAGAVSGKKRTFTDWTIGDLTISKLSNVLGSFGTLGLKLTEVKLADDGHSVSDINIGDGISFNNVAAGEYAVKISGQLTGGTLGGHHYGLYNGGFSVSPVPEPETYALLLAGLLAVGYVARRRSQV